MKITHIIESSGGSADFVLNLVEHLPHHEHTVIHSQRTFGSRLEEVKMNHRATQFIYWNDAQREIKLWLDLRASLSLFKILKVDASDAIHLHSSKAGFLGRIVCFLLRKKNVIYTPNGLSFLRQDVSRWKRQIYILLEKVGYFASGKIISCSKSEANELIKLGMKSDYINNGTDIFENRITAHNREVMVIATTGRVTIQKNPQLFNNIASAFEKDPRFQFVWIGGGELEHQLTAKNIQITGWLNKTQVLQHVQNADIYISTASWEGLPFAVVEAMNLYKPLILSRCVGNIDLVQNDYNGYLYTSASEAVSKIKLLHGNRSQLLLMGTNSHAMAGQYFDVEKMALEYEQAYKSIAGLSEDV
jgi:glycosyltransferase involved in cell wall biosynthesis